MKPHLTEIEAETLTRALLAAHKLAMESKELVFKAQDQVSIAWRAGACDVPMTHRAPKLLRKLEKRLARVRAELEAIDRETRYGELAPGYFDGLPLGAVPGRG